jgi:cell division protein FtsW
MARRVQAQKEGVHQHTFFELGVRRLTDIAEAPSPEQPATKLFFVVLALMGIGMAVQAGHAATTADGFSAWFVLVREHLVFRVAGIVALIASYYLGPRGVRRFLPVLLVASALLLVMVYIEPFGTRLNGARRWVQILPGLSFQPSELARIVLVLWIADRCVRLSERLHDFRRGFLPMLAVVLTFFALVAAETDLGGSLLLFLVAVATMWVGGGRATHLALSVVGFGGGAITAAAALIPYVRSRIDMFLGPVVNDQVQDSLQAISLGGMDGLGLAQGVVRTSGTPYLNSDYVFSQIGEELGFFGTALVLLLFVSFLWFSLRLVLSVRDRYAALAAFGLLLSVAMQAMIHIQVNAGLAPPKGMTLPFISAGGTSLIVSSIAVGLALGASRHARSATSVASSDLTPNS